MTEDRIHNPASIDTAALDKELKTGREMTIQFSYKKYDARMLALIDQLCATYRDNLCIRFYDHGNAGFDVKTVLKIPQVKNLHLDNLGTVKNFEALADLENLSQLRVGIHNLPDHEFLRYANLHQLKTLSLDETLSSKLNLAHLPSFNKLNELILAGHTKNIAALAKLRRLKKLTLFHIKNAGLAFVNEMIGLRELDIIRGGRTDINEISNTGLKKLVIDQVMGFNDVSGILLWPKLVDMQLRNLKQLRLIEQKKNNSAIRRLDIFSCENLIILKGLDKLHHLKQLRLGGMPIPFEQFIQKPLPPKLSQFDFYTFNDKNDKAIRSVIKGMGYNTFDKWGNAR